MTRRDINSVQLICQYGQENGVTLSTLLKDSGISDSQLSDGNLEIDAHQELAVLKNLLDALGNPFKLGIELGSRYQLTMYGIIGYALLSSATMRKAITLAIRYLSLTYSFCDISMEEQEKPDQLVSLKFNTEIPGELGTLVLIRDIWAAAVLQKELFTSSHIPFSVHLSLPAQTKHRDIKTIEDSLGGHVIFNEAFNGFCGPSIALDLPLPKANALTAQLCEDQCKALLLKKQEWQSMAEQVRDVLLKEGLNTSMEEAASKLARTSRTLHRQLSEEGTSWRRVRDDVRIGLAEELLRQPIKLDEIAERLGYSDASNFSHSFKRCHGCSPSDFRKRFIS